MLIDILMLTDCNYVSQVKVTMYSICENTDQKIVFTILCDENLDQASKNNIVILEKKFSNIKIKFHQVDLDDFKNAKSDYRVPVAAYYRLIAANVVNAKKAIYLDSDLIVEMDIKELYNIDIEKYYVAGVRDLTTILSPNHSVWYASNFNLENFSDYINSGVLLMNLDLMRRDGIVNKFLAEMENKNLWVDQDVINRVCHGKIRLIDWKFNHSSCYSDEEYEWNYKPSERKNKKEILHFIGPVKPWKNLTVKYADVWWNTAKKILEEEIYKKIYKMAFIGNDFEKVVEIVKSKCLKNQPIIIVGYSDLGIIMKNNLLKYGIKEKILFCDNNQEKRTLMLSEKKIYCPEDLAKDYKESIWINVVQEKRNEILEQLKKLDIPDEHILNYSNE